jgi:hypothetical protein
LPTLEQNVVATFADDIAIMAIGDTTRNSESTEKLQTAVTEVQRWTRKWRIKLNDTKSVHVDFTNKRIEYKQVYINHHVVPHGNTAKYNKLMLYQQVLKPIWTCGIQLWGCTSQSNKYYTKIPERVLRDIVDAPWFIRNYNLHKDLAVETINTYLCTELRPS